MKKTVIFFVILVFALSAFAVDVTFRVNMSYQTELGNFDPATDFVDIAGNFNEWQGSGAMEDTGNGIYQVVITDLDAGYVCEFKFRINANWDTAEFPGGSNRTYTVVEGENIAEYWYNDQQPPAGEPATITFLVNDSVDQTHSTFYLKGSWDDNGVYDPMWGGGAEHAQFLDDGTNGDQVAGDHIFTAVVELYPDGGEHTWEWGVNDEDHNWMDGNWQFTVADTTSQTFTYNVPTMTSQDVTVIFSVNMNLVTVADTVFLAGDFNNWQPGANVMTDDDADGIYTTEILFPEGSERYHEFKFVNGTEWENINNRSFIIDDTNPTQTLETYYFNDLDPNDFTQQDVTVHFSVNMSLVESVSDTVSLCGDFNDWTIGATLMTDDNQDNIYEAEFLFPAGSLKHHEYKFVNGNEFESIDNRILEIDDSSSELYLEVVYFNNYSQNTNDNVISAVKNISVYPNPFIATNKKNSVIFFDVNLTTAQPIVIKIYNLKGEKIKTIKTSILPNGKHKIPWNTKDSKGNFVNSGVYLYRTLNTTGKFTLLK